MRVDIVCEGDGYEVSVSCKSGSLYDNDADRQYIVDMIRDRCKFMYAHTISKQYPVKDFTIKYTKITSVDIDVRSLQIKSIVSYLLRKRLRSGKIDGFQIFVNKKSNKSWKKEGIMEVPQ